MIIKNIDIITEDKNLLKNLFGYEPTISDKKSFDNISLEYKGLQNRGLGFNLNEIIISLSISLVSGVASGIVANIIYAKLMQEGKNKMVIKEDRKIIVNKKDLIIYIEDSITKEEK
ncbi:hypothetical protein QJU96_08440 [Pasteurella skyensis]|uniref:hypothetical protein n=1 Tax=Phocoenobacter skyensis TaxID=97481 RepID=UPI00278D3B6A|nr:hypothetical protein [Pasteurella skyensis]MDP8171314.1 hypothetical protein [Pasteurella skyensis]